MNRSLRINRIVSIALMTAIICVISPFAIAIPVSPVPISLATLAIYLTVMILGWKGGTISVLLYVLIGLAGAPVFTGFSGGAGKVLGPTGGYIIGYIFLAFIEGIFVNRARTARPYIDARKTHPNAGRQNVVPYKNSPYKKTVGASYTSATILLGMLIGTVVLYIFGSLWLAKQLNMSLAAAFTVGVFPFVIGDVIKMVVALFVGTRIRKALVKSNLI